MNKEILLAAGIDYENGVRRFMDDKEIYEDALMLFTDKINTDDLCKAHQAKDYPRMFDAVHSLKGVFANMDMPILYSSASKLTELLRRKPYSDNEIEHELKFLSAAFDKAVKSIKSAMR